MRRSSLIGLFIVVSVSMASVESISAGETEGVHFNDASHAGTHRLTLRGIGTIRRFVFIKICAAGLYLEEAVPVEKALANVGKRLEMYALRVLKAPDFVREAEDSLAANLSKSALSALRPRLNQLHAAYEDLKPGDRYALTYVPESGTQLELNGTPRVTIEGEDFAAAYFAIWLGPYPISKRLKEQLIGGRTLPFLP